MPPPLLVAGPATALLVTTRFSSVTFSSSVNRPAPSSSVTRPLATVRLRRVTTRTPGVAALASLTLNARTALLPLTVKTALPGPLMVVSPTTSS